jgi:hypothetical protein
MALQANVDYTVTRNGRVCDDRHSIAGTPDRGSLQAG